jgi:hypothetical protein
VLVPGSLLLVVGITLAEFAVHYHVDWFKEQVMQRNGWTSHDRGFWYALGTDQLVHGLTYLVIVAVLVVASA